MPQTRNLAHASAVLLILIEDQWYCITLCVRRANGVFDIIPTNGLKAADKIEQFSAPAISSRRGMELCFRLFCVCGAILGDERSLAGLVHLNYRCHSRHNDVVSHPPVHHIPLSRMLVARVSSLLCRLRRAVYSQHISDLDSRHATRT